MAFGQPGMCTEQPGMSTEYLLESDPLGLRLVVFEWLEDSEQGNQDHARSVSCGESRRDGDNFGSPRTLP